MDGDTDAVAIGLGAGLGGFVAFVIVACILWHVFCGSWCEKKKVQSTAIPLTMRSQRMTKSEPPKTTQTTVTPFASDDIRACSSDNKLPY